MVPLLPTVDRGERDSQLLCQFDLRNQQGLSDPFYNDGIVHTVPHQILSNYNIMLTRLSIKFVCVCANKASKKITIVRHLSHHRKTVNGKYAFSIVRQLNRLEIRGKIVVQILKNQRKCRKSRHFFHIWSTMRESLHNSLGANSPIFSD